MNVEPISAKKSPGCSGVALGVAFGCVFFLPGAIFLWVTFLNPILRTHGSGDWLETQCTVIASELAIERDSDKTTYRPRIEFEYTVGNGSYTADTYDFTQVNRSKARCREIIAAHPVGKRISCFVDPAKHDIAVIARDYEFSLLEFIFPLILVIVGLSIAGRSVFYKEENGNSISGSATKTPDIGRSSWAVSKRANVGSSSLSSAHLADAQDSQWDVPKTLKPAQKRTTTFLFTLLFTVFWNVVVSVIFYSMINKGLNVGFAIFPILFMIPFVLVGLGLIGGVFYTFAAIFNPTVELALSTGAIERGGTFDVAWQLSGRNSIVNTLKVTIEGEESATYRRGTDTITDTNIFCSLPIAEVTESQDIGFGSATVTIPADTMHTFTAGANKISWRVTVVGDIPYWPDIKESYEFRVKP